MVQEPKLLMIGVTAPNGVETTTLTESVAKLHGVCRTPRRIHASDRRVGKAGNQGFLDGDDVVHLRGPPSFRKLRRRVDRAGVDARDSSDLTRCLRDTIELIDASTKVDDPEQHRGEHYKRQTELNERLPAFARMTDDCRHFVVTSPICTTFPACGSDREGHRVAVRSNAKACDKFWPVAVCRHRSSKTTASRHTCSGSMSRRSRPAYSCSAGRRRSPRRATGRHYPRRSAS